MCNNNDDVDFENYKMKLAGILENNNDNGDIINEFDRDGNTLLMIACLYGNVKLIEFLVMNYENLDIYYINDREGVSAFGVFDTYCQYTKIHIRRMNLSNYAEKRNKNKD